MFQSWLVDHCHIYSLHAALKSLSEEMHRVIGDQPICSSNLCWARRMYIIDCASFVLSVLSIIMNVAEDRCVSVRRHSCSYFMSEVLRRLPVALLRRTRGQLLAFPHKLRGPGAEYPWLRSSALTRPSIRFKSFRSWTFFCTGPVILTLLFFGGLSLSLDGGRFFYKSVHAAPYGSWTPRIGFMSSVFFDDVHGVKPDFKNYRIAGVIIIMPIINRGQINTMIDNNILIWYDIMI